MQYQLLESDINCLPRGEIDRLEICVKSRLKGTVRDFRLQVMDEGLILHGQAPSYYAKQLAQHAIMEATRIPILVNNIRVLCAGKQVSGADLG